MRPTEVTDDQIIQAGNQLESEQVRVTGFALRRLIGAGTPTRLIKVWNGFKEGAEHAQAPKEEAQPLPGEIEPALKAVTEQMAAQLRQLVVALNANCQREAYAKIAHAQQEADAKCALYLEELTDASGQIENAEHQIEVLERHTQQQSVELSAAHERIAALTGELARAKEKLEQSELELERARALEARANEAAEAAERSSEQLVRDLEQAKHNHAEELGRHQEALSGEREKRHTIEKKLNQVQVTCDALSEQSNAKRAELASANSKIKGLEDRVVEQGIRLEEQRSVISSQRQSVIHLERHVDQLMSERKQAPVEAASDGAGEKV